MDMPNGTTNQKTHSQEEPFVIPSFGNIGPPFMATLSLPRLTIGSPVWLFSSLVIPNIPIFLNQNAPSKKHQHHVYPSPSSPYLFSSRSPSLLVNIWGATTQVSKRKKKERNIKNKKDK